MIFLFFKFILKERLFPANSLEDVHFRKESLFFEPALEDHSSQMIGPL
jgi:hypothetical protein